MNRSMPLIITGMHRSGTSLIARFVHHSGVDLGDQFVGARASNPYGHYEDVEILELQQGILLREFGHSMWVPGPPPLTAADRAKARALVAVRKEKLHWGWKEPRTSLFLDLWDELLPDALFLFVARHPLLVLDSLSRRNRTRFYHFGKHARFLKSWLIYNRACLDFYQSHDPNCLFVTLEGVLQQMDSFARLLSERLSFAFDASVLRRLYDPGVLARKRRRQTLVSPALRAECLSFHDYLCKTADLAADGDSKSWTEASEEHRGVSSAR
jgi:hypothetical protein